MTRLRACLYELGSPLCPGSPVCQYDNTSLFIWAGRARFVKPAHLTGITKSLFTWPAHLAGAGMSFYLLLLAQSWHFHPGKSPERRDGVFIWKIVPSRQPRSRLQQLRSWEAGQTGSSYKLNGKFYRKSGRCRDTQQGGLSQQTELARLI